MSSTKKITLSIIMGILLSILISQCKSPTAPTDIAPGPPVSTATDTTAVVDTSALKTAPIPKNEVSQAPLTLIIKNLRSPTAVVEVGLYGTKNKFPDPKDQLKVYRFTPNGKELTATITDQPFGTYALAIYQDTKGQGKIAKNFLGIPTDPYAFSQNYVPKIKAPNFEDCKFTYDDKNDTVTMTMIN